MGDKLITHYEYDSDKNLTRQWTKMQGSVSKDKRERFQIPAMDNENRTLLADYHYSYDGNGNRTGKEGLTGKTSYQYDTLNRLVKVQYPKGLEEFTYDKADNRIRRLTEKEEELYKYDVCNRLVEKQTRRFSDNTAGTSVDTGKVINQEKPESMKPQGSKGTEFQHPTVEGRPNNIVAFQTSTFQYDNQGNLLREERKTEGSRQESLYSYDGFNRQKKIVNFENKVQVNHYDGEGLRHEMEENGKLVKFLYADREAVAEEKEDGNVIRFIRGYDLIASDSESARTYYHYASDEQESITHVLGEDENGEYDLKNYYEYGAFGDFREKYEEVENRFGYNGEIFDPVGGQYYLRARYYNPVIGRFTQEDTYYGAGLNLYAYCRNLPVGYIDPSGHYPCQEKLDLYKKYRKQGLSKQEANIKSNYDLIKKNQGKKAARKYLANERNKQRLINSGLTPKQATDFMKRAKNAKTNAEKGIIGEEYMDTVMKNKGYEKLDSKVEGNHGIDGIYVKRNSKGEITDLVVGEAKFGSSRLNKKTKQMTNAWIEKNIGKLDPKVGSDLLDYIYNDNTYIAAIFRISSTGYSNIKYRYSNENSYQKYK